MKNIIMLIGVLILLTGCFDYVELNELSIITMITIDKNDSLYDVSFEILNDQKEGEKTNFNKSIIVNGIGSTIKSAINDAISKTPKQAYFAHLKVIALSKKIAQYDLNNIIKYFLRAPNVRNEFYLTIVDNNKAKDILNVNKDEIPIISNDISSMLKGNKRSLNNITNSNFENILIDISEKGKDATIPTIKQENNKIKIVGSALLHNYKLIEILSSEESSLLNVLLNNASNTLFTFSCPNNNNNISLSLYDSKIKKTINKTNISIDLQLKAQIEEYNCDDNLKKVQTFEKYNEKYKKEFENKIYKLYQKLNQLNTDSLGIGKLLYDNRRYYNEDDWLYLNPIINVDLKINKEGLIYEVNNGN